MPFEKKHEWSLKMYFWPCRSSLTKTILTQGPLTVDSFIWSASWNLLIRYSLVQLCKQLKNTINTIPILIKHTTEMRVKKCLKVDSQWCSRSYWRLDFLGWKCEFFLKQSWVRYTDADEREEASENRELDELLSVPEGCDSVSDSQTLALTHFEHWCRDI